MISSSTSAPLVQSNISIVDSTNTFSNLRATQQNPTTPPDQSENSACISSSNCETNRSKESKTAAHELSESDKKIIAELKKSDRDVRAHEAAHMAASGGLARGGASYSYAQGPDGRRYAVGGEVAIDASAIRGDPEATLQKAQTIIAAALAPAQPSNADRAVAASASQMAASARAEIIAERNNSADETGETAQSNDDKDNERGSKQDASILQNKGTENGIHQYQQVASNTTNTNSVGSNLNILA